MLQTIQINLSPKKQYKPLYTSPAMRNDLWGGRGRGGSHEATLYALFRLTSPSYCRIAFIRKIYNDVRHSLWKDFKDRVEEAEISSSDIKLTDRMEAIYHPTGNTINCFGVKAEGGRTAKLKSLAGYNLVIIEEADELTEDEFNMIEDSLRTVKGEYEPMIIRVFNPPGRLHWIWKDYNLTEAKPNLVLTSEEVKGYWRATPKEASNLLSVFGTFRSNVANLAPTKLEKWRNYRTTNLDYYLTMYEGLISEGQRGRIYSGWKPITQAVFQETEARSIWWLDFGWSDSPMALGECKFIKNKVRLRQQYYRPAQLKEVAIRMCELGIGSSDIIVADSEDRVSINKLRLGWPREELSAEELEKYPQLAKGFYVLGAWKPPGSLNPGIDQVKEMEVEVCEDSNDIWMEYRDYKWALDKDKNPTNMPEDKKNHHMDGIRYVITGKGRLGY